MRKPRHRDIKSFAQAHTVSKQCGQDSDPGGLAPKSMLLTNKLKNLSC